MGVRRDHEQWNLAYTLQNGLDLGQPYTVPGYPTGINYGPAGTGLPWSPATDGLRHADRAREPERHRDDLGDHLHRQRWRRSGADPNKLVEITDPARCDDHPGTEERFRTLQTAHFGEVLRGVSFTPGTSTRSGWGWGGDVR